MPVTQKIPENHCIDCHNGPCHMNCGPVITPKVTPTLHLRILCDCPNCEDILDLLDACDVGDFADVDGTSYALDMIKDFMNNKPQQSGLEVTCQNCMQNFLIEQMEY